ncbi:hypothetical protein ABK040_006295 [Willaertia magna]
MLRQDLNQMEDEIEEHHQNVIPNNGKTALKPLIPGAIALPNHKIVNDELVISEHFDDECCSHDHNNTLDTEDFHFLKVLLAFSHYEKFYFEFFEKKKNQLQKVKKQSIISNLTISDLFPQGENQFDEMKKCVAINFTNLLLGILEPHLIDCKIIIPSYNNNEQHLNDNEDNLNNNPNALYPRIGMVEISEDILHHFTNQPEQFYKNIHQIIGPEDFDKVNSTIKQFVRDWSIEGLEERQRCYGVLIQELQNLLPLQPNEINKYKVLTPGAGLGRLTWEIARLGYASEGNEFSFYMLLASNFILNYSYKENETFTIFPYITQLSNLKERKDQFFSVEIPDIHPGKYLHPKIEFAMVAGDFIEVYNNQENYLEKFDSVITCFFIDTASNIFEYLKTIYFVLRKGGYWINLGPLLWHHLEMGNFSVEVAYDELKVIMEKVGFEIIREEFVLNSYTGNKRSMSQMWYQSVFFTALKR